MDRVATFHYLGVPGRRSSTGSCFSRTRLVSAADSRPVEALLVKVAKDYGRPVAGQGQGGVFPVICGGDHSLGFPNVRGIAPHIDGNVGIIHFDSHLDCEAMQMDERMHGTPWYYTVHEIQSTPHRRHTHMHEAGLPNCLPHNLVQIGIGGWAGLRDSAENTRRRGANVLTVHDVARLGPENAAALALEQAWKGCKGVYLSVDIDSIDPAFAPGTGSPEPGAMQPREVLQMLRIIAREGLCGMEVVEISPPYDVSDVTALLGCRLILDTLAAMVTSGKLGHRSAVLRPE